MYKIRIHGRGGQGAKTAAKIIGGAAFREKKFSQAFALYGAERRGAPVTAFVRIDDAEILERGYVTDPDCVVVLDDTLLELELGLFEGLHPGGVILINTKKHFSHKKFPAHARIIAVDASKIALKHIGKPIFNTTMIGALAKATGVFSLEQAGEVLKHELGKKNAHLTNANLKAMRECFNAAK